ncbi:MAG TPA: amino acid adenylation domain-containing protein, partial [Bacteroidia bacterium]|nr:amino acid adenylation domain-containing protein [Bacteroidia bacterium]
NTLALRSRFESTDSYLALLKDTRSMTLGAYDHQIYPFDELVECLNLPRDMSRNALFDVMVVLQNATDQVRPSELGKLKVSAYEGSQEVVSKFDLSFTFEESGDILQLGLEYNSDLFDGETIERMALHLELLLESIISSPATSISDLNYLSEMEKKQLTETFNSSQSDYDREKTIVDLLESEVLRCGDGTALICGSVELSYEELNSRSNRLAHYLQSRYEIKGDDLVGIELARDEWMIISMLGILKSGGGYVPIDMDYPADRKKYMKDDSGCKLVIDAEELMRFRSVEWEYSSDNLRTKPQARHLAYVIYTSGSTGQPKGVMIEHASLADYVMTFHNKFGPNQQDRIIQQASFSFDTHVEEVFSALTSGAVILMNKNGGRDIEELKTLIENKGATILTTTPLILSELNSTQLNLNKLRLIISGGDRFNMAYVSNFVGKLPVYDSYGPTESTICATFGKIEKTDTVSTIGQPMTNRSIFILNNKNQLQAIGIVGEICIGGTGLARGYLNRPELTAEKFIPHPFKPNERLYKTGDMGRWLANGNIEFLGRKDDQVKVRGYRIELGEVENVLQQHPSIDEAIVLAVTNALGELELITYIVGKENLIATALRSYLNERLPAYMVPGHYIQLDQLPLTPNGKVDRKKLVAMDVLGTSKVYEAPRNNTEEKLIALWQEILGKEKIGVKDNFFELGGNSIKITRLASRLYKEFEVKVAVKDLFMNTILEEQALLLQQSSKRVFSSITPVAENINYPLSNTQKRLFILAQFEEGNIAYNMPGIYVFEGNLNLKALRFALNKLVDRHESLRTVFKEDDNGEVKQFILSRQELKFSLGNHDLRGKKYQKKQLEEKLQEKQLKPFDLSEGPLLRASLFRVEDNKWIFVYVVHHIISDEWSMKILVNELGSIYNSYIKGDKNALPPLQIQFKDYVSWQQQQLAEETANKHKEYWLNQFEGELPVLELPADFQRPAVKSYHGGIYSKTLDSHATHAFKKFNGEQSSTLFMGLLALVNTLLYKYSGQQDIIIGTPVAGRAHVDLENQIGLYLNTLALRNQFNAEDGFKTLLGKTKQLAHESFEHQIYPFDELVDKLNLKRDMSRSALFDVMLVLQNNEHINAQEQQEINELSIAPYQGDLKDTFSKFDLTFSFNDTIDGLQLSIEYNSDIYLKETIIRLADHLECLMQQVVHYPEIAIGKLNLLNEKEKIQLLEGFNGATTTYNKEITIIRLIEEQVSKTPDEIAVLVGETTLTYRELNEKANQLAAYLREEHKIEPDDLVGIMLERNEWLIIVMLGILKSGAAYVPIDLDYPQERIAYIISDSQCKLVIENETLNRFRKIEKKYPNQNLPIVNRSSDLAYIIYTSGSTGKPKGVMIEHGNVSAFIDWCNTEFSNAKFDLVFCVTSICFDLSVFEIFYSLSIGKKIRLLKNALSIPEYLNHNKRILLNTVPSVVGSLLRDQVDLSPVTVLNMAGEPIPRNYITGLIGKGMQIRNLYGPSEDTTYSTVYKIDDDNRILIGKPISNTQVYILNENNSIQPIGVTGEICISGDGLARGYLNKPELTAERFVTNPFKQGERMYKTGDLGRWMSDGNIDFIGRKDNQVKIRGHRIELGEVEFVLQKHPAIAEAVVMATAGSAGELELTGYIVSSEVITIGALRTYLGEQLPAYMVPGNYVQLDALPLTPNGKVDRKKLPAPGSADLETGVSFIAPRNEREEKLLMVWQELLEKSKISVMDNFFDLGGTSLKAMKLLSMLNKNHGFDIKIQDIYNRPTIEGMAFENADQSSRLLSLSPKRDHIQKVIYFIPPALGNSIIYKPLADTLQDKFNCYGLQYKGMETGQNLYDSIEQAAKEFSNEIVKNQAD